MIDIIFGIVGVIGTGVTIWQATVAKGEVTKAEALANEAKYHLDEILKVQKAIDLGTISNEVNQLYKRITDLVTEVKGRNENKIKKELLNEISRIAVLIPNEYLGVHDTIQEIKVTILYHITKEASLYCSENGNQNGITRIYDLTYIVLKNFKDSIEDARD